MLISATGRTLAPTRADRGFTLVEVLVVLLVIALVGSLVTLTVNSGSATYELNAANRMFRALAEQARTEAELTGQDHGLTFEPDRDERGLEVINYRWWRRTQEPLYEFFAEETPGQDVQGGTRLARQEWEVLDDILYEPQRLPWGVEIRMAVNDVPVDLARIKPRRDQERVQPLVVFYASGEATPAVVEFLNRDTGDSLWRYEWDLFGQLQIEWRGEALEDAVALDDG